MNAYKLDFCDSFCYPPTVRELITAFADSCYSSFGKELLAIKLIGSGARGELTFNANAAGPIDIYSDLEFFVTVNTRPAPQTLKTLREEIDLLQHRYAGSSPFFHIDYSVAPFAALKKPQRKFIHFESNATGKTIYGEDPTQPFPKIDASNLNFKDLNEVLFHRLWSILLYLPAQFLSGKGENHDFKYIVCRNVLDITLWLLPYEKNKLIAGFNNRLKYINTHWHSLSLKKFFTSDDLAFLHECYEGKMHLRFSRPAEDLYIKAITLFITATRYMLYQNKFPSDLNLYKKSLAKQASKLFEGNTLRQKASEAYMIKNQLLTRSPADVISWLVRDKRLLSLLFCFSMHCSNIDFLQSSHDNARTLLHEAENYLIKLHPRWANAKLPLDNKDHISQWQELRRAFVDYRILYERGYQPQKDHLYCVLGCKE